MITALKPITGNWWRELPYNGEAGCIDGRMQCREHHAAAVEPFEWCVRHFQKEMRAMARANWMLGLCCDWRGIGTRPSVHAADQCKAAAVEECSSQLICCWLLRRCARLGRLRGDEQLLSAIKRRGRCC